MPYDNQFATGESLLALEKSASLRDFEGVIKFTDQQQRDPPPIVNVHRNAWLPARVVAIDGSTVTHKVKNGFPGAEASLIMLSVVFIDISKLAKIAPDEIPSPRVFNEMDQANTLDAVLPGANVKRSDPLDTPIKFFRKSTYDALSGSLDPSHESLIETLRAISGTTTPEISCPIVGCDKKFIGGVGEYNCECPLREILFETDGFRFHERFNELGTNGEVHGEVRHVLEVLALVNILRYFELPERIHFLKNCAFVLDGPLAVFGQPARIAPYVRRELMRISEQSRLHNGCDILVMGVEKTGQYVTHFFDIDWTDTNGPRSRFTPGTVLVPDAKYINRNIVFRPSDSKPSGEATYFGRKVFYKTKNGAHAVVNLGIVNSNGTDFTDASLAAFPRLSDSLNVLDHLSTYLYQDGFMPLVRAHAHAAIPLKRGTQILASLFSTP